MLALLPASGRAQGADATDAPLITQEEFKKLVAANDVVIVDSRSTDEFEASHVRGAVSLPFRGRNTLAYADDTRVAALQKTSKPIVVYCACHGEFTSARLALMLKERGAKDVRALLGGWNDWVNAGNPIVKATK